MLQGGRLAGYQLHDRRSCYDRRNDGNDRQVEEARRLQHRGIRSRSVYGRTEQVGTAVARNIRP